MSDNAALDTARKLLLNVVARPETHDITVRQFSVFLSLLQGPRTVRDVAIETNLTRPSVSRAADWLEQLGFMQRHDDPADRRSVQLVISPAGKRFLNSVARL